MTVSNHGGDGIRRHFCVEDMRLNDSLITYNKGAGLRAQGNHDTIVSACHFEENFDGVVFTDGFNLTCSGNNIDDHLRHGVVIENSMGSLVTANMIEQCNGAGLVLARDAYGTTVSGNLFAQNGANRVMTRGKFAYVGSSLSQNTNRTDDLRSNVSVIDLSDPEQPKLRGSVDFPDARGPNGLEISGTMVLASGGQTVQALDIANPGMPCEMGRLTAPGAFPGGADDAHDLVYAGGHLLVTAQTSHSLVVVRVQDESVRNAARPLTHTSN